MDLLFDKSMYRLYKSCEQKNIAFRMATIPQKMDDAIEVPTEFNPDRMLKLFNIDYNFGMGDK